ncbi:HD-GYP domain-containing protein [Desulforhopalus sp. IMCC35007]|uniref:HD-GYP domain-containing protein n=1 Tax=Desulforhopalus sp. IMCC35007 TaxID=2569543 RepID=UPI0010ADC0DE|nr:HD domain-containing phosphohydrolase [Desulforhopalus sp. IMCC35007]TKB07215.1 response regulator [Desulforhopalus sp. IMCC35007]
MRPENTPANAPRKHRILVIEDQEEIRDLIANYLNEQGYEARTAENGLDGLFILEQWPADLVTVDMNMPIMNGRDFIEKAVARWAEMPIVVVSGIGAVEEAVEAIRLGAHDFITKPIENFSLVNNTIERALEAAELVRQNRHYQANLEKMVEQRTYELQETKRQLLYSLGKSAEYRDNETGRHVIRVGEICALLGKACGLEDSLCKTFGEAAPLHDIGKIGISDTILLKPGKLTAEEWEIMKSHCEIGCNILRHYSTDPDTEELNFPEIISMADDLGKLTILEMAMVIALCHHEKWDGGGYPCQLSGMDIPLIARIVAVVDVYDALSSDRPYKKPLSEEVCQQIIREGSGNHFDPEIIDRFFENIDEIMAIKKRWMD